MAILDSVRDRMRRQRPVGAAEEMQQGMPMQMGGGTEENKYPLQHNDMTEADLDRMQHGMTPEVEDAYNLGRRMGLQSLAEMSGQSVPDGEGAGGRIMTKERLNSAMNTLMRYRNGKKSVNERIINSQEWWKLNNWDVIKRMFSKSSVMDKPQATAWLWNAIVGKHADAMDSYPEPVILPRMRDDEEEAKRLSSIIPVVMEMNDFENTYSECSWQKLREGTGAYGIFWDTNKLGGLGDIAISKINMLNLYWEPGVTDIQESRNLFFCTYVDKDELYEDFPQLQGKTLGANAFADHYKTDDNMNLANKVIVVDWYYKKREGSRKILHYCKFVGEYCIYSSEEEAQRGNQDLAEGYYHDGEYPFVLDPLFPVEGSPAGYGYIDIGVGAQTKADLLDDAMTVNAIMRSRPRYFTRKDGSINEEEFMNWDTPIVHTNGNLGQDALRQVEVQDIGAGALNMLDKQVEQIKFVTGNTDVMNGGTPAGVTAASAIAALHEDAGRSSKDSTKASYRAQRKIVNMVIERIRQFYDVPRMFRIMGNDNGSEEFVQYDNRALQVQQIPNLPGQEPDMRLPVFDIDIRAQRETVYTKMANNELIIQLWGLGVFNPQIVDQALNFIKLLDFRDKEKLTEMLEQSGTIRDVLVKVAQIALALSEGNPAIQQQLAMVLQSVAADVGMQSGGGIQPVTGGGNLAAGKQPDSAAEKPAEQKENPIVTRARETVQNASRPQ